MNSNWRERDWGERGIAEEREGSRCASHWQVPVRQRDQLQLAPLRSSASATHKNPPPLESVARIVI